MLALYLMLSETYYAHNYAGIIGLGLSTVPKDFMVTSVIVGIVASYSSYIKPL